MLIKASEDRRVKKVITWAGVSDFKIRFQEGAQSLINGKMKGLFTLKIREQNNLCLIFFNYLKTLKKMNLG